MTDQNQDLLNHLLNGISDKISDSSISHGDLTLIVTVDTVLDVLKYLRDDAACAFTQLLDVCGVDYPERAERFDVVYHLLSMTQNQRVRVKLSVDEKTAVPSATDLFDAASWFEREAFDLYGILFSGHPDLRRLLTDRAAQSTGPLEQRIDEALGFAEQLKQAGAGFFASNPVYMYQFYSLAALLAPEYAGSVF